MSDKINPERGAGLTLPALALTRAGGNAKPAPASVYLLADHLDTVLAAAEDIVAARLTWNSARRAGQLKISEEKHSFRDDIEDIRKLENTIIIRVLKSRERAEDVARNDKRFRQLAKLYSAGTAVLLDAVEECGDSTDSDFATADSIPAYLRSRGLVDPDAPAPAIGENLQVGEDFLIAKRIAAGPLMDLAAALLDALELHYDLFLDENELAMAPQINRFDDATAVESQDRDGDSSGTKTTDPELEAAIENVREQAARETDTSLKSDVWTKMSTAGSVLPPVVSPPVADPLVVVSKTDVVEDTAPQGVDEDVSEDDVPTEIVANTFGSKEPETSDEVEVAAEDLDFIEGIEPETTEGSEPASEPNLELATDDTDDAPETVSDTPEEHTVSAKPASSDDSDAPLTAGVGTTQDDGELDQRDNYVLDSRPDTQREVESRDEPDDSLIITAANDDDTSAQDDTLAEADATDTNDEKIALIADNTDTDLDAITADSADTADQDDVNTEDGLCTADSNGCADDATEHDAAPNLEADASDGVEAENETSGVDGKKKTKSLLGRLSLIKP